MGGKGGLYDELRALEMLNNPEPLTETVERLSCGSHRPDDVDRRMFFDFMAKAMLDNLHGLTRGLLDATRSPIEDLFAIGLMVACYESGLSFSTPEDPRSIGPDHGRRQITLCIEAQPEIAGLHPDFVLTLTAHHGGGREHESVAVECDGHDFHEKTKEQASRDKSRDRKFLLSGLPVVRFTGSELYRAPVKCAHSVLTILMRKLGHSEFGDATSRIPKFLGGL